MTRILILLSAFLILSTGSQVVAQDTNQAGETSPAATETERPKTEVDELLEKAKERGEVVLTTCLQDCQKRTIVADYEGDKVIALPKPRYPSIARMGHACGQVIVQVLIDVDGSVIAAAAISGHPLLYGVSVEAARNSKFKPMKVGGKPVKMTGGIVYNFIPPSGF